MSQLIENQSLSASAAESSSAIGTVEVAWVQISERRQEAVHLPYSIGLLQAYAQSHAREPERYRFRLPIFTRVQIQQALEQLRGTHVVGFSCYIWNVKRSLAIAKALKELQPETLIVFGGPQVPQLASQAEEFLRLNPQVNVLVNGEGEAVFLQLLEAYPHQNWDEIPGIAWLDQAGFHQHPQGPRIPDLASVPSPFLSGVFDPLIQANPDLKWIAVWETNRGCPFSCSFCDWGGLLKSKVHRFDLERLKAEAEWFGQRQIGSVFSADANFGILPRDVEIAQTMVDVRQRTGYPKYFQTQMAKNVRLRSFEIHSMLAANDLDPIVSLSLQSLSPAVLEAIKRQNISLDVYRELQTYCQQHGLYCYTDLIIGLPQETYDSFAEGVSEVIKMGQHTRILFHNATILPNAEMGDPAYRERYGIETIEIPFPGQTTLDQIHETMPIVVATHSFTRQDWVKMNIFAWMTFFLYYTHRTLQPLFIVLHSQAGFSFRELIEVFCLPHKLENYKVLKGILNHFTQLAEAHVQGQTERFNSSPLLFTPDEGKILTPDMMAQTGLTRLNLWQQFFQQANHLLMREVYRRKPDFNHTLFQEASKLSQAHFYHQCFGVKDDQRLEGMYIQNMTLPLCYNLWDFYEAWITAKDASLELKASQVHYSLPSNYRLV